MASSSSSSTITPTTVNGVTRVTGLASGINVDSIVQQLITADSAKLNSLKQQEQLAEWKQEAYRNIITSINSFASKYFDITSSSCILNQKTFQQFSVASSSTAVTAAAASGAAAGSHTIQVSQLATAATLTTSGRLSKDVQGIAAANYSSLAGKSFVLTLDGTSTTVTLDSSVTDAASLQAAIDNAVGSGKVTVSADASGVLSITAAAGSGVQKISIGDPASGTSALSDLGFGAGATLSNRISTSSTLATLAGTMRNSFSFNAYGQVQLAINGVSFTFDQSITLAEMMQEINQSSAGVTMKYDDLNDQLVITASATGAQKTLTATETGSTFLSAELSTYTAGQDAKLTVDGTALTRSSNTVTVNGITYTLNQTTSSPVTVTVTQNVDAIVSNITNFVNDYNSLIATINGKLSEKYDPNYPPLTDAQKAQMTDTEISQWEAKAQTGLLANDPTLQGFLDGIRQALSNPVSGQSVTLASIGITTGSWEEQGKLYVDTDKLTAAIQNNPTAVMNLFTQQSASYPGTATVRTLNSSQLNTRYAQEGVAYRFYDVLQKYVSTIRDSNGNKGVLLQIAGMEGDTSVISNQLTQQIIDLQGQISKEQDRLNTEEDNLYNKYTAMESYIEQMNSQLAALLSYTSSSTSSG